MPFEKGRKKTGGAVKGVRKKLTQSLIDQLGELDFDLVEEMHRLFFKLEGLPTKRTGDEIAKTPSASQSLVRDDAVYLS